MSTRALLLDLDGTLLQTGRAGGQALWAGFAEVHGVPVGDLPELSMGGCTDLGLLDALEEAIGAAPGGLRREVFRSYHGRLYSNLATPDKPGRALPGAQALLEHAARVGHILPGLLTGNTRQGARIKLEAAGLGDFPFLFGAFGDEHPDRPELARRAARRARALEGEDVEIWVIGDTPKDIGCARAAGLKVAAVSTGSSSRDELAVLRPDLLVDSLDSPEILALMEPATIALEGG